MNELQRIRSKYLLKDGTGITYSDINEEEINKMFHNMGIYERPDILSMYDNKIVAIEHFEFDSYKNTSKGSNFKIQNNRIEQKMQKEINSNLKDKGEIMIHDQIENTNSLKQYYNNFRKVVLSHIDNIHEYKEHIINDFGDKKKIEFWFFIEDVSPLGSYYYRKTSNYPALLLPFSKENIEILKQHKEIKGLIFGIYAMSEYKLVLMYNDEQTLKNIENSEYFKVEESEFISFTPQTTGFALLIPEQEKEMANINEWRKEKMWSVFES